MKSTSVIRPGDEVTFVSWGVEKRQKVTHISRDGKIVFLDGLHKWVHRSSIFTVNGIKYKVLPEDEATVIAEIREETKV